MASAKGGSKKSSAKKGSAKKTPSKKTPPKKAATKKGATKKRAPAKTERSLIRSWSKQVRAAAIAAATALATVVGVAVARAVRRRVSLGPAAEAAACTITGRGDVARIVLTYIRGLGFPNAAEGSNFTSDIPTTPNARRVWAGDLVTIVQQRGCRVGDDFGPDQCADAERVREIIDSLWESVQTANGIEG
ncbi:MAG TPA: hypothetical protein VEU30_03110 [Thermoanaerobaculia bacterium]|nr:hypothetical protein [Thermoanaerobaculia bacterium]